MSHIMNAEVENVIPTVDLSPFFNGDEEGKKQACDTISRASQTYGFFQIINHGIPIELMRQALDFSKQFFALPDEEKHKIKPVEGSKTPLPAGYSTQPEQSEDKNECFMMFTPDLGFNLYPDKPAEFKGVIEEYYKRSVELASLLEEIINDCMGFPPNFFKEYNNNRSFDFMIALRYFSATEAENNGMSAHEDPNCITLLFQEETGGLEVLKDGNWIQVEPNEGHIIVNIDDTIQVLSNNKFKSATHRVIRKGRHRHSIAFFLNIDDKWIEPLLEFTTNIGESPKYRGFQYNEYLQLRMRNKTHPSSRPEDVIHITHYSI